MLAVLVLAVFIVVSSLVGNVAASADAPQDQSADERAAEVLDKEYVPMSTPRDQWAKGQMPYLYQIDPEWKDESYSGGTIELQGCGPAALAMSYIYLTGNTDKGIVEMAQFATDNGFSTDGQGSMWTLMSEGANLLGLESTGVPATPAAIAGQLEQGHAVVCVMAPGTFTKVGHFIAIEKLDADGKAVVHDSNSVERSGQTWDLQLICDEANAIWGLWV